MPLFSILIPTRNRSNLLRKAIRSVLKQDWNDYELVISDNDSTDSTYEVVRVLDHPKIRYIRTSRFLPSPDNWEYARQHASGDYIWLIGDDDYFVPGSLREMAAVIRERSPGILVAGSVAYFDPSYPDPRLSNCVEYRSFTGKVIEVDTAAVLKAYFEFHRSIYPPHPSAVCISRSITDRIATEFGAFFAPPFPEFTAIPRALTFVKTMPILDKPLVVVGLTAQSWGSRVSGVIDPDAGWKDVPYQFRLSLFKGHFYVTGIAESLLTVKRASQEQFREYDIALDQFCVGYYRELIHYAERGRDIESELREFREMVASLPAPVQTAVRRAEHRAMITRWLRRLGLLSRAQWLKNRALQVMGRPIWCRISGEEFGISDIESCAESMQHIGRQTGQYNPCPVEISQLTSIKHPTL